MTSNVWRIFCENVMPQLNFFLDGNPWEDQTDNCVLLLDNAQIHDAATDELLQANGVHFICLPPYSPDLQPGLRDHNYHALIRPQFYTTMIRSMDPLTIIIKIMPRYTRM